MTEEVGHGKKACASPSSRKEAAKVGSSSALADVTGGVPTDFSSIVAGKSHSELMAELAWTRKLLRQRLEVCCCRVRESTVF